MVRFSFARRARRRRSAGTGKPSDQTGSDSPDADRAACGRSQEHQGWQLQPGRRAALFEGTGREAQKAGGASRPPPQASAPRAGTTASGSSDRQPQHPKAFAPRSSRLHRHIARRREPPPGIKCLPGVPMPRPRAGAVPQASRHGTDPGRAARAASRRTQGEISGRKESLRAGVQPAPGLTCASSQGGRIRRFAPDEAGAARRKPDGYGRSSAEERHAGGTSAPEGRLVRLGGGADIPSLARQGTAGYQAMAEQQTGRPDHAQPDRAGLEGSGAQGQKGSGSGPAGKKNLRGAALALDTRRARSLMTGVAAPQSISSRGSRGGKGYHRRNPSASPRGYRLLPEAELSRGGGGNLQTTVL